MFALPYVCKRVKRSLLFQCNKTMSNFENINHNGHKSDITNTSVCGHLMII